jgi:hypothetical protein
MVNMTQEQLHGPPISDDEIIQELDDAIEYLETHPDEIEGLEADGNYLVSVPELVKHTELDELTDVSDKELMEDIDQYAHWVAREAGFSHTSRVNRHKKNFDTSFGQKYWSHREDKAGYTHDLTVGEGVEMPHFKITGETASHQY